MKKITFVILISFISSMVFAQTVDVHKLLSDFDANKIGAESTYGGNKYITVKGVIKTVDFDIMGNPYVLITETGGDLEIIGVQFSFAKTDASKLIGLTKSKEITLKGKFDSDLMSIVFKDSSIIQYSSPADSLAFKSTIDAVSLYNHYQKNGIRADSVYRGKEVTITGLVVNIDKDLISKTPYIILSGDGSEYVPIGMRCLFVNGESTVAKISKGSKISITGTIGKFLINLDVNNCRL